MPIRHLLTLTDYLPDGALFRGTMASSWIPWVADRVTFWFLRKQDIEHRGLLLRLGNQITFAIFLICRKNRAKMFQLRCSVHF